MTGPLASRAALLASLGLLAAGCSRLNPAWCDKQGRCAPGERCEPSTNTCVRLESEAGGPDVWPLGDGRPGDGRPGDGRPADRGQDHASRDQHPDSSPCAGKSGWSCIGGAATLCSSDKLADQRRCPLGQCSSGHCSYPVLPKACVSSKDCTGAWVCTLLLDASKAPKRVCAAPVTGTTPPATCASGLDCSTGLCTAGGQCYYACDVSTDCPANFACNSVDVSVEGVKAVGFKSCEQLP